MPAAPQHCPLPRLLEVDGERPQMHHSGDGTHDLGHAQNVSISFFKNFIVYSDKLVFLRLFYLFYGRCLINEVKFFMLAMKRDELCHVLMFWFKVLEKDRISSLERALLSLI